MVYHYIGLSLDTKDGSAQLNDVIDLSTPSMGQIELIIEDNDQFPQLLKLLEQISSGDIILVYSISKFGVNSADALNVLCVLMEKKVNIISFIEGKVSPTLVDFMLNAAARMRNKKSKFSQFLRSA